MIIEVRPDKEQSYDKSSVKIFLAGTIDNGSSEDWQSKLISELMYYNLTNDSEEDLGTGYDFSLGGDLDDDIVVFNPRRADWNPSWGRENVEKQIKWEQEKMDEADIIVMNILDCSSSPISLLELGLYGPQGKMIVFCTDKFFRFTNVKLTCEKYLIDFKETTDVKDIADEISRIYNEEF
jgi:hypothetical protein